MRMWRSKSFTVRSIRVYSYSPKKTIPHWVLVVVLVALFLTHPTAHSQKQPLVLHQDGTYIAIEPYSPSVIRVTLSTLPAKAAAAPGYGVSAQPSSSGWSLKEDSRGHVYTSSNMVLTVEASHPLKPTVNDLQLDKYFNFLSSPRAHITVTTPEGKILVDMLGWSMSKPNDSEGNMQILNDKRPSDEPFYRVGAVFDSPADEHYYGLGQNQEGFLDLRGHAIHCWHNYVAPGGESVC